ncbi:MAG: permease [Bacillota bacterium]
MIAVFINISALFLLIISFLKDKEKSKKALKIAMFKGLKLAPQLIFLVAIIGIIFAFLPPELIKRFLGGDFSLIQVGAAALFGAIMMIPSLIALPLAGSLIDAGASYTPVAAFITTLTMVGFVTIPIEIEELGKEITFYRNGLALIFAILISFMIGVFM